MSKELIRLSDCTMSFDGEVVLDHLNLYINDQEFLTLLGRLRQDHHTAYHCRLPDAHFGGCIV